MKLMQSEFAARLASGATTTCLCWRLTRSDGFVVGVTDHDKALTVEAVTYNPGGAVSGATFTHSAEMQPGQAGANGVLSSEAIREEDLQAGLWNAARIDVFRVDWQRPDLFILVWSGRFSDITYGVAGFEAELVSLKADLERPVGRVFSRRCDAVLGDERCGVDLSDPAFADTLCDQRFETCKATFRNVENFRGFPHMPGNDAILAGPALEDGLSS